MKNDVNNTTEKLGVSKDETSSSDNKENRNTEIVNISMTVKRWYSVANFIYSLLVGYAWVRYMIGNPASRTILRLIGSIFVLMILCVPYTVKVEPLKAKLPIWLLWMAVFAVLFTLAIVLERVQYTVRTDKRSRNGELLKKIKRRFKNV